MEIVINIHSCGTEPKFHMKRRASNHPVDRAVAAKHTAALKHAVKSDANANRGASSILKSVSLLQRLWRTKFRFLTSKNIIQSYVANGPTIAHVKSIR
jgi:hypothetical protein